MTLNTSRAEVSLFQSYIPIELNRKIRALCKKEEITLKFFATSVFEEFFENHKDEIKTE